jgi:mannosyltransferase OCH1-like enzyme
MNISQIYISDVDHELPDRIKICTSSVKKFYPNSNHIIYNHEELRFFIAENFGHQVKTAMDMLVPFSYKCDFARFCLLYIRGGVYADIALTFAAPVGFSQNTQAVFFRDIQKNSLTSWSVAGGLIYSKPGNDIFIKCLENIIQNIKDNYYGVTPLCPTGPTLLGRNVANAGADPSMVFGDYVELTPNYTQKNRAFIMQNGDIWAYGKKSEGGDLTMLGAAGVNNYNQLWRNKSIYLR